MSIGIITANQTTNLDLLRHNHSRLRRTLLVACLLLIISALIGGTGWYQQRSRPRPDYYKIFLSGLADQHYRLTGTTTVVIENEGGIEYLQQLYHRKTQRDHQPDEPISLSRQGVLQFSFVPGTMGLAEYPLAYLIEQPVAPSMSFSEPAGAPLALWIFSRSEHALAIIFTEQPPVGDFADPGLRLFEMVTSSNALAVAGNFHDNPVVLTHAYLLPLDNLGLDLTGQWWGSVARLNQIVSALPLLFGVGATDPTGQGRLNSQIALNQLSTAGPPIFELVARGIGWIVTPLVSLWVVWVLVRLRQVWQSWQNLLAPIVSSSPSSFHYSFPDFLTADLEVEATRLITQSTEQRREEIARQQTELKRHRREAELRQCLDKLAQLGQPLPCQVEWMVEASATELDDMLSRCRRLAQEQQERIDNEEQTARERLHKIQWLESEFAAIPLEKRAAVIQAWTLYEQACASNDSRLKLDLLKSARKFLPKEFRKNQS